LAGISEPQVCPNDLKDQIQFFILAQLYILNTILSLNSNISSYKIPNPLILTVRSTSHPRVSGQAANSAADRHGGEESLHRSSARQRCHISHSVLGCTVLGLGVC